MAKELQEYYSKEREFEDSDLPFNEWIEETADDDKAIMQEEAIEYLTLTSLAEECEGIASDWSYGETLIRESYWEDYCRELVSDIGDLPRDFPSYIVIDWEATAENLLTDYSSVEFDGETYYIRSC